MGRATSRGHFNPERKRLVSFSIGDQFIGKHRFIAFVLAIAQMTMASILLVFAGSGLGGVVRYLIGYGFRQFFPTSFPLGTLVINLFACLLASWLVSRNINTTVLQTPVHLFLLVGFCGGFSTFSTFSLENARLIQEGLWVQSIAYTLLSIIPGVLVFFAFNHGIHKI